MKLPYQPVKIEGSDHIIQCPYSWDMWKSVGCDDNLKILCKCECLKKEEATHD